MKEIEIPKGYKARIEGNKVIFEPKESEDEKIRKEIIEFFQCSMYCKDLDTDILKRWVTYLEKQKPSFKQISDGVIWDSGLRTGIELEKQKEHKLYCSSNDELEKAAKEFREKNVPPIEPISDELIDIIKGEFEGFRTLLKKKGIDYEPQRGYWEGFARLFDSSARKYVKEQKSISATEVLARAGLKPYKDGNKWCILVGDNIQEGICGFGDTIEDALYEFLKEILNLRKEQKPADISGLHDWKFIVDAVLTEHEGIGQYLDNPETERIAKKLQERFSLPQSKPTDYCSVRDEFDLDGNLKQGLTPSEEDEIHKKWILEYLYDGLRKADDQFKDHFKSAIDWFEKYKEREGMITVSKETWDENAKDSFERGIKVGTIRQQKKEKESTEWKPTDEQYYALRDAIIKLDADDSDARFPWKDLPILHSLRNDLYELKFKSGKQKEQKPVLTAKEAWKEMRLEVYAQASGNRHEPNCSDDSTKMFSLCDIDEIIEKIGDSIVGQKPVEEPSKEDYVKKFKALCDAYEIKLPRREYDIYHLCEDMHKLFGDVAAQKPVEWSEGDKLCVSVLESFVASFIDSIPNLQQSYRSNVKKGLQLIQFIRLQPKQEWSEDIIRKAVKEVGLTQHQIDWFKTNVFPPKQEWNEDYREEDIQTRFAFYTYKDNPSVLYLSNVFVEETSRNHGFGTCILKAAEKVAETICATTICLKVKQGSPANAWYRKHGYGYVAFEDGYDWLEKNLKYLKPVKSAEWSEEDEKIQQSLLRDFEYAMQSSGTVWGEYFEKKHNWLKSLPERFNIQVKQELQIKEGDKVSIHCRKDRKEDIIAIYDGKVGEVIHIWDAKRNPWGYIVVRLDNGCNNCFYEDELEILNEPKWKPSEEQMKVLKDAIIYVESSESNFKGNTSLLASLLEQLKKLM